MRMLKGTAYLTIIAALTLSVACSSSDSDNNSPPVPPASGNTDIEKEPTNNGKGTTGDTDLQPVVDDESTKGPGAEMDGTAGQLYAVAFEAMMKLDEGLNSDMKYIAVDLSEMTQLTTEDKSYIMEYLQSFNTVIRDRTLEQLQQEENNEDDPLLLSGVFLRVDKVDIGEASALIEGAKYRSGTGAIGVKVSLEFVDGLWKLSDTEMNWIS
ncbi:hypothetical protein [Paenibacillus senegalimassiliensis]|uniref:hypothetical protein n=1 Tax=Paenibacillus senegalimassiliensis TaxID=1737426 RepID=UPI00073EF4F4|nr:hypothetical protein [Paenibacillus senegalimassiliensis]